jgi:hypothetical protein
MKKSLSIVLCLICTMLSVPFFIMGFIFQFMRQGIEDGISSGKDLESLTKKIIKEL